jgi:hypothetical protein
MKADRVAVIVRISPAVDRAMKEIAVAQDKPVARVYRAAFEQYALRHSKPGLHHNDDKVEKSTGHQDAIIADQSHRIPGWIVVPALLSEIAKLNYEESLELAEALNSTKLTPEQQSVLATRLSATHQRLL